MRALASHVQFRIFWINTAATVVGRSMVTATLAWLALGITGSALMLAWVAAAQFVPTLFVSLLAGGLVDRVPKNALIIATSVIGGVVAHPGGDALPPRYAAPCAAHVRTPCMLLVRYSPGVCPVHPRKARMNELRSWKPSR